MGRFKLVEVDVWLLVMEEGPKDRVQLSVHWEAPVRPILWMVEAHCREEDSGRPHQAVWAVRPHRFHELAVGGEDKGSRPGA